MEVLKAKEVLLCDSEVLHFLRQKRTELRNLDPKGSSDEASNVALQALEHLESRSACAKLKPASVSAFLASLSEAKLRLAGTEKNQIINQCPTSLVEIQLMVEDCEERFNDHQVELILRLIRIHLLGECPSDEEGSRPQS